MGALQPWHVLALLCCLLAVSAVVSLVVWVVMRPGNRAQGPTYPPAGQWYPPPPGPTHHHHDGGADWHDRDHARDHGNDHGGHSDSGGSTDGGSDSGSGGD